MSKESVEIIAHRGASFAAPENTMAAFKLGWQWADGIELDIQRSKDGRAMAIHDPDTNRVSGKNLSIADTDSDVLRTVDVGSHKGKEFADERIPFIEEVLAAQPKDRTLLIEIKCSREVLPLLYEAIKASGKQDVIRIIGFDIDTITAFKEMMPTVPVFWLFSTNSANPTYDSAYIIKQVTEHGLDGVDLEATAVNKSLVDAVSNAGLKFYVWTVDDPQEIKRMADVGVDGITTNRPDFARSILLGK